MVYEAKRDDRHASKVRKHMNRNLNKLATLGGETVAVSLTSNRNTLDFKSAAMHAAAAAGDRAVEENTMGLCRAVRHVVCAPHGQGTLGGSGVTTLHVRGGQRARGTGLVGTAAADGAPESTTEGSADGEEGPNGAAGMAEASTQRGSRRPAARANPCSDALVVDAWRTFAMLRLSVADMLAFLRKHKGYMTALPKDHLMKMLDDFLRTSEGDAVLEGIGPVPTGAHACCSPEPPEPLFMVQYCHHPPRTNGM